MLFDGMCPLCQRAVRMLKPLDWFKIAGDDKKFVDAEATIDVAARKLKMQKVERILQDAAVVVQPMWRPVFILASVRVHGYQAHPARQMQLNKVWLS